MLIPAAPQRHPPLGAALRKLTLYEATPLVAFVVVYLSTCYVGALCLIVGPQWVRTAYVYLSGAQMPHFGPREILLDLALLNLAPVALAGGWAAVSVLTRRLPVRDPLEPTGPPYARSVVPHVLFAFAGLYLLIKLAGAGAFSSVEAWSNYQSFLAARRQVIQGLGFWDFVLAYSILPVLAGLSARHVLSRAPSWRHAAAGLSLLIATVVIVQLLLFQKRSLIIAIAIPTLIVVFSPSSGMPIVGRFGKVATRAVFGGLLGFYCVYLVLLVAPVLTTPSAPSTPGSTLVIESNFSDGFSGWNTAGGFLLAGASETSGTSPSGGALAVTTRGRLQGVEYATGSSAFAGSRWQLTVAMRATRALGVTVLLGDHNADAGVGTFTLSPGWRTYRLDWTPDLSVSRVDIALRSNSTGSFAIEKVTLHRLTGAPSRSQTLIESTFDRGVGGWGSVGGYLLSGSRLRTVGGGISGDALGVNTTAALQGASYPTGLTLQAGHQYQLSLWLRAPRATPVTVLLGRNRLQSDILQTEAINRWQHVQLAWTPRRDVADVEVAIRSSGRAALLVDEVHVIEYATPATGSRPRHSITSGVPFAAVGVPMLVAATFPAPTAVRPRSRAVTLLLYTLLAPFTRTAGPAIAYPGLYPRTHPYYPLDTGLDEAGIGRAPDDNLTSFQLLFPTAGSGTNSVPFMFTLYSQGGIWIALLGSFVLGVAWGAAWRVVTGVRSLPAERSILMALLVIYGVFIAGDSARDALLASYGLAWPGFLVVAWMFVRWRFSRHRRISANVHGDIRSPG